MSYATPPPAPTPDAMAPNAAEPSDLDNLPTPDSPSSMTSTTGPHQNPEKLDRETSTTGPHQGA